MVRMNNVLTATMGGLLALTVVTGCGAAGSQDAATTSEQSAATQTDTSAKEATFEVDYGTSERYTQEDVDAAVKVVMGEFDTWKGATMKKISFTDDTTCENDLAYCNEMKANESDPDFDEAMVLKANFHSPSAEEAEGTAWEPDRDYNDYEWHLARTNKGEWVLVSWGYA